MLTVVVTVMGTVGRGIAVERAGARPGDVLLITGPCGGSAAGLRVLRADLDQHEGHPVEPGSLEPGSVEPGSLQLGSLQLGSLQPALAAAYRRPVARLAEGELARLAGAHAMIDVSDGLALDLHRLADASGVGFALESIPVAEGATLDEALGGGEDYELIVAHRSTGGRGRSPSRCAAAGLRPPLQIGVTHADPSDRRLGGEELGRLGWQHAVG